MVKTYAYFLFFWFFILINSDRYFEENDDIRLVSSCYITQGVYYFTDTKIGHVGSDGVVTELYNGLSLGITPSSQITISSCLDGAITFGITCTANRILEVLKVTDTEVSLLYKIDYSEDFIMTNHKCTISYTQTYSVYDVGYSVFDGSTIKIINLIYSLSIGLIQEGYNTEVGQYTSGDIDPYIFCYSEIILCIYRQVNEGIRMKLDGTYELISATDSNFRYYIDGAQVFIYFKENEDLYVYSVALKQKFQIKSIYNKINIDDNFYGINYDGMDYCIITYLNGYTGNSAISEYFILDSSNNEYSSFSLVEINHDFGYSNIFYGFLHLDLIYFILKRANTLGYDHIRVDTYQNVDLTYFSKCEKSNFIGKAISQQEKLPVRISSDDLQPNTHYDHLIFYNFELLDQMGTDEDLEITLEKIDNGILTYYFGIIIIDEDNTIFQIDSSCYYTIYVCHPDCSTCNTINFDYNSAVAVCEENTGTSGTSEDSSNDDIEEIYDEIISYLNTNKNDKDKILSVIKKYLKILKQYDNIEFDFQTIKIKLTNSSKIDDLNSKVNYSSIYLGD